MKNGMETVKGTKVQVACDGHPNRWPGLCLWGQCVGDPQHAAPRVHVEEEIKLCLPLESVAMNECMTGHVPTKQNPAGLCTKVIPRGAQQDCLVTQMLYDLTIT